jgi:histidine decarboxylase
MNDITKGLGSHPLQPDLQQRLSDFLQFLQGEADHFLGYPCTRSFDYTPLYPFLGLPMNNVGDPFIESRYHLNSHEYEREVIRYFAGLTHANPDEIWGYVTNGGTEGNMYGIILSAKLFRKVKYLPGATRTQSLRYSQNAAIQY